MMKIKKKNASTLKLNKSITNDLFGVNYTGPYVSDGKFQTSVAFGEEKPTNRLDAASRLHDSAYNRFSDILHRRAADLLYYRTVAAYKDPTFTELLAACLVLYGNRLLDVVGFLKDRYEDLKNGDAPIASTIAFIDRALDEVKWSDEEKQEKLIKDVTDWYDTDPHKNDKEYQEGTNLVVEKMKFVDPDYAEAMMYYERAQQEELEKSLLDAAEQYRIAPVSELEFDVQYTDETGAYVEDVYSSAPLFHEHDVAEQPYTDESGAYADEVEVNNEDMRPTRPNVSTYGQDGFKTPEGKIGIVSTPGDPNAPKVYEPPPEKEVNNPSTRIESGREAINTGGIVYEPSQESGSRFKENYDTANSMFKSMFGGVQKKPYYVDPMTGIEYKHRRKPKKKKRNKVYIS